MITVKFYHGGGGAFICNESFNSSAPDMYQQIEEFIVNLGYMENVTYIIQ